MKPPFARINPYDGTKTPHTISQFPSSEVSAPGIKNWILNAVPDYSHRLATTNDLDVFQLI